jgi:hypothetical protein
MRKSGVCLVVIIGALAIAAYASAAGRNRIHVSVPAHVAQHRVYDVTVTGYARHRARAYLFIDYAGCAKSFAAERRRARVEKAFVGLVTYRVHWTFSEVSGWKSSSKGADHACAYLVAHGSGRVLAHDRISFRIH